MKEEIRGKGVDTNTTTDRRGATPPEAPADPPVRLKDYGAEDWLAFAVFWGLAVVVFLQFFGRYVINDSPAWTEEIARYLLAMVAYMGGGMAVRKFSHIHVEFLYVYLPRGVAWAMSCVVDVARILFFGYAAWLGIEVTRIMHGQFMVVRDTWPMSIVFGTCTLGLAVMTLRAIQVTVRNWMRGTSPLVAVHDEGRHQ
jgi:TRAP-type C4-dicarboxylate transport system permease small subunit